MVCLKYDLLGISLCFSTQLRNTRTLAFSTCTTQDKRRVCGSGSRMAKMTLDRGKKIYISCEEKLCIFSRGLEVSPRNWASFVEVSEEIGRVINHVKYFYLNVNFLS
jgi:hypothetical protein